MPHTPEMVAAAYLHDVVDDTPVSLADVQTVKLADVIDNICDVVDADATFARVDLPEKRDLVDKLTHGDPALWARADALVREGMAQVCLV